MNRLIIFGESVGIDAFRNYRNVHEDATFGIKGHPDSRMLKELISGKSRTEYTNAELNSRYGIPNDSVTARLIEGSSTLEIREAQGKRVGVIESILDAFAAPPSNILYDAKYDARLMRMASLETMSDESLLQIAFSVFDFSKYGKDLKAHFSVMNKQPATDLNFTINKWYDDNTKKDDVVKYIKDELYKAYVSKRGVIQEIIVPPNILGKISFSGSVINLSEWIAMGGVQYVNVKGYLLSEKWGEKSWDSQGRIIETPTIIQVRLDFIIGDWFGVDEGDVISRGRAAQLGRRELAALWVLQHQRGYKPFICFYKYSEVLNLRYDITQNT